MLRRRRALSPPRSAALSARIRRRLAALEEYRQARIVFLTYPVKGEVDLTPLLSSLLARGAVPVLPRCKAGSLQLLSLESPDGPFLPDDFGIPAPRRGKRVPESKLELLLMPGLAFDTQGNRLGYGKGMLDELARRAPSAHRLGLCFAGQLLEHVPHGENDVPMQLVVTEKTVIRVAK